jgi:hypothetical protein
MCAELPAGERPAARAPLPKHLRDRLAAGQHGRNAMTRPPRLRHYIDNLTRHARTRVPAGLSPKDICRASVSRRTMAYAGVWLALAGIAGAAAAAELGGHAAATAGKRHAARRAADAHGAAGHSSPAMHASPAMHHAPGQADAAAPAKHKKTWAEVARIVANRTYPRSRQAQLPAQDMLTPVGTSGPQVWMQITPARYENAQTIVRQAIGSHMGLRAAVIAVATSMQESTLLNLAHGDSDSLGLFQQRPSCGWGTPAQILRPAYAAGAFLHALRSYQASNPDWARQPLWESAQGVQGSAFPAAYARWEAQAAQLVASVTVHMF